MVFDTLAGFLNGGERFTTSLLVVVGLTQSPTGEPLSVAVVYKAHVFHFSPIVVG